MGFRKSHDPFVKECYGNDAAARVGLARVVK
jgi:hypothetical protein